MKTCGTIAAMNVENSQSEHERTATSDSWLASLVAFIAWLFHAIAKLKRVKRTTKFKANWRDHFDGLRHSEWHMAQMLAQGAALLLSGKTLDDADYVQLPMPPDFGGRCPRTAFAMNLRFLKVAQFMRDPERYIRRHAARIAKRDPPATHCSTAAALRAAAHHEAVSVSGNSHKQFTLMVSRPRSGRPSNHEGELRCQLNAQPRGPPRHPYSLLPQSLAA